MKSNGLMSFLCVIIFLSFTDRTFAQTDSKDIIKMKSAVKQFFIDKGEIDATNKLDVVSIDVTDGSELGNHEVGIYIIRTEYRTDGIDYLFFKNGKEFEIIDFNDLQLILSKTNQFLHKESDEKLLKYLEGLIRWYKDNLSVKNKNKKIKIVK